MHSFSMSICIIQIHRAYFFSFCDRDHPHFCTSLLLLWGPLRPGIQRGHPTPAGVICFLTRSYPRLAIKVKEFRAFFFCHFLPWISHESKILFKKKFVGFFFFFTFLRTSTLAKKVRKPTNQLSLALVPYVLLRCSSRDVSCCEMAARNRD